MSGNASRTRGRARELAYLKHLRANGWMAWRIDGCADIVAMKEDRRVLIQCKSTVTRYSHFPASDREWLRSEARAAGAEAVLVWWPKQTGLAKAQWIDESEWPAERALAA